MGIWVALGGLGHSGPWSLAHNAATGTNFPHDTWFHFAYTITQRPNSVGTLYINGVMRHSLTSATTTGLAAFDRMVVGGSGDLSRGFVGALGDLRIYRKALSLAEVGQLYAYKTFEYSNCQACPLHWTSPAGSVSVTQCMHSCPAGQYQETRVLNPPEGSRSYSSVHSQTPSNPGHAFSILDGLHETTCWIPTTTANSWMQIDAGAPMLITGVITQGRSEGTQYATAFTLQAMMLSSDTPIAVTGSFSMTDGSKKVHMLTTPIYARYVRILPTSFLTWPAMRAALVVRTCSTCLAGQVSPVGSTSAASCQCAANSFLDQTVAANRAIALLPGTTHFSTLARRTARTYAATAPFTSCAGPSGTGAVTFDRTLSQYLDGGAHAFNIATNGGFTAVVVVRFTGVFR